MYWGEKLSLVTQLKEGFNKIFDLSKETITRRRITRTYDSDDDVSESNSDASIEGVIQVIELEDVQEYGGLLQVGDAVGFFEATTDIQREDQIIADSITYEVDRLITERSTGNLIFTHAFLKRVKY